MNISHTHSNKHENETENEDNGRDDAAFEDESDIDNIDDWNAEEIDSYNIISNESDITQQNEHILTNEWICHQCDFANNRLSAIRNNYKCTQCNVALKLTDQRIQEEDKKKYIKTHNQNIMASSKPKSNEYIDEEKKHRDQENVDQYISNLIDIDSQIAIALQNEEQETGSKHQQYNILNDNKYETNIDEDEQIIYRDNDNISNSQLIVPPNAPKTNTDNTSISELVLPNDSASTLLPIQHTIDYEEKSNTLKTSSHIYRPSFFNGIYGSYHNNYDEIEVINIDYDDINDKDEFVLNWNHIIHALDYKLCPLLSKALRETVESKQFKITATDFSEETIKIILNKISEEKHVNQQQISFIKEVIETALRYNPITQCDINEIEDDMNMDRGILYWIGTDRNMKQWSNPSVAGHVKILSNAGLGFISRPLTSIVGRECIRFCAESRRNTWIMIDLLKVKIKATHYSLQHYVTNSKYCLRNWYLEGSNNSTNGYDGDWTKLSIHKNLLFTRQTLVLLDATRSCIYIYPYFIYLIN